MKSRLLVVSNVLIYLSASFLVATGLTLKFKIDEHSSSALFLGLSREGWGELHFAIALTVIAATLLHLFANLWWISQTYQKWKIPTVLLIILGALPALILLLL
jgi:hypothetical protein